MEPTGNDGVSVFDGCNRADVAYRGQCDVHCTAQCRVPNISSKLHELPGKNPPYPVVNGKPENLSSATNYHAC